MPDPRAAELSQVAAALDAQYVVERELGRGGMGVVYLARDRMLDRLVAIKTLPAHLAGEERIRERFVREARTAANLSHPNIVPIHRADEIGGVVFFVMGYVDGESLAERVQRRGPLPAGEVVRYLREVADALDAAHRRGVIHRDVKAENILIESATGRSLVTDFGIARVAEAAPITATGLVLGSVHYMSPEHAAGETVDARSDVYSLGVVAFHALSGRFPFENESASAVLIAHVTRRAPALRELAPDVPASLAAVVDRCLAKEPDQRFQSCRELREALDVVARELDAQVAAAAPARAPATRMSETEAQRVLDRAARLDEGLTAGSPPLARRDVAPAASAGYELATVRESAREAGISTRSIDRVLAEREVDGASLELRDNSPRTSIWSGAPAAIEYEIAVDGEVPERDFDRLVETIRRSLGDVGLVTSVGRSLTWSSADPKRRMHVSVQTRGGRTTIRVAERLAPLAGAVYGGGVGGFGGGLGGAMLGIVMSVTNGDAMVAVPTALGIVLTSLLGSRFVFVRTARSRREHMRDLAERLATEASAVIAERAASRRLPSARGVSSDERERVR